MTNTRHRLPSDTNYERGTKRGGERVLITVAGSSFKGADMTKAMVPGSLQSPLVELVVFILLSINLSGLAAPPVQTLDICRNLT